MEVSHTKDFVTHAVIGGAKTIDFGISSSAEFFNILSSTLYKDQILAVVRETLCNAWDAHIEAGIQHVPVQLTLTDTKLVIRDFGTGIHRDDIGPIYGVYGNSTKKNDGRQTGGFGLGCKAPFAYVDHFEVISHHDGVKTIYNMSKSNAEVMGKPGIIPIGSFPTTETGLQVSIAIRNRNDAQRFKELIHRIAHNGDMNMTLNGEVLPKLNFDLNQANYLMLYARQLLGQSHSVMVRYGNVIYPVEHAEGIAANLARVTGHLRRLASGRGSYSIVFQAPPHSISVQPSREGLSMQDHTVNTLNKLFADFMAIVDAQFVTTCAVMAQQVVQEAVQQKLVNRLLSPEKALPTAASGNGSGPLPLPRIADLQLMARQYLGNTYPADLEFRKKDIRYRLEQMAAAQLLDRGRVQTFLREMETIASDATFRYSHYSDWRGRTKWLHERIIGPLLVKLQAAKLDPDNLYVFDKDDCNAPRSYNPPMDKWLIPAKNALPQNLFATLPYLRNIVVVCPAIKRGLDNMYKHDVFTRLGKYPGFLYYRPSTKKADKEAAVAFFKARGMEVVDLTEPQPWEIGYEAPKPSAPRKPAKKGLPLLNCVLGPNGGISIPRLIHEDAPRILNPEFVLEVSLRKENDPHYFAGWDTATSCIILDLFGSKGAVINNSAMAAKYIEKGAKTFEDYVAEKVCVEVTTNPRFLEYWAFCPKRAMTVAGWGYYEPKQLLKVVYALPELRQQFGIINNLTDIDRKYLALWRAMSKRNSFRARLEDAKRIIEKIPLHQNNGKLLAKFRNNPALELVDADNLRRFLLNHKDDPAMTKRIITILTTILDQ